VASRNLDATTSLLPRRYTAPGVETPTKILTVLIADVRGYTAFTEEHGIQGAARLADRFAVVAREVVEDRDGRVVELRGDEVLAVFTSPRQALRSAVELRERCAREMEADPSLLLKIGVGVDAGELAPVQGGYRGRALNLAARLCDLAGRNDGGQGEVFATQMVLGLAGAIEGLAYLDRGEVQVKGLRDPVRVMQVVAEGDVPDDVMPLRPANRHPSNLPGDRSPFVGRDADVRAVADLLRRPALQLLTLTGTAGTGKTRLALEVGSTLLEEYPDGVFFVSLASLRDPNLVPSAIASTLGVLEVHGEEMLTTLSTFLSGKRLLLILDNFEHLLPAALGIADLLDSCQQLCLLVTSREPLHLSREHEYAVSPLALPTQPHLPDLEQLRTYDAVGLFVQRARMAKADFELTEQNAAVVVQICRRLDGLPLAIELAAARVRVLPPESLLHRLDHRLKLLTGGPRDVPERQQTLRGAIAWSYDLLGASERTLFARLAVFSGGCTFEAAEAVCTTEAGADLDVLDSVESLLDKSLLQRQSGGSLTEREWSLEPRFAMLETVREYALERLAASGEEEAVRRRHAQYYLSLLEQAVPDPQHVESSEVGERLHREHDNFRAALRWFLDRGESQSTLRMVWPLSWFWATRGYRSEARVWITEVLAQSASFSGIERVRLLRVAGGIASMQGDEEEAQALLEEALSGAQSLGDADEETAAREYLALVRARRGQWNEAVSFWQEQAALARERRDRQSLAGYLQRLGDAARYRADHAAAVRFYNESLDLFHQSGDEMEAVVLLDLGLLSVDRGETERAAQQLVESLTMVRDRQADWPIALGFEGLARVAAMLGQDRRAARLWAAADSLAVKTGFRLTGIERSPRESYLEGVRSRLGEAELARVWQEGQAMELEAAVDYALEVEHGRREGAGAQARA
jgi:predicted ATPase/class 3 adenylate cyclase